MRLILITMVLFLSGCSATMVPVMDKAIDSAGNVVTTATPYVTEASVAKSTALYHMHEVVATVKLKAYKMQGVSITFDDEGRIKTLTARGAMPDFSNVPQKVDVYPAWAVVEKLGTVLFKSILFGYGIHEISGVVSGLASGGGTTYNGDFNATQSLNSSQTSQGFDYSYAPITGE